MRRSVAAGPVLVLALAGCGGGAEPSTVVRVAALTVVDDAPLFVAQRQGLFRKAGLDVRIRTMAQSTLAVPSLLNGSVDVVAGANYVTFFQAQARRTLRIRVLADGYRTRPGVTAVLPAPAEKTTIRGPSGLRGKKVAFSLLNSVTTMTFDRVVRESGTVEHVKVPFPDMITALRTHSVDAAYTIEPFTTAAQAQLGVHPILDPTPATGPTSNWPMSGYISLARFPRERPGITVRFQRAIHQAQALCDADRSQVERVLPTYTQITPSTARGIHLGRFPANLSPDQLQRVADLAITSHLLPPGFQVGPLVVPPRSPS